MPPYLCLGLENRAPHGGMICYSVRSPTCEDEGGNISAAEKIGPGEAEAGFSSTSDDAKKIILKIFRFA